MPRGHLFRFGTKAGCELEMGCFKSLCHPDEGIGLLSQVAEVFLFNGRHFCEVLFDVG